MSKPIQYFASILAVFMFINYNTTYQSKAKVIVSEKTTFYQVSGQTGRELLKGFDPKKGSNYSYIKSNNRPIAYVHFKVETKNVQKRYSRHNCFIRDADVVVNAHYLFPKWHNKKNASPLLRETWDEFIDYAIWHEKQHVALTKNYAKEYLSILKNTQFALLGDCNVMPKHTKKIISKLTKQLRVKHKKFDRNEAKRSGRSYKIQSKLRKLR